MTSNHATLDKIGGEQRYFGGSQTLIFHIFLLGDYNPSVLLQDSQNLFLVKDFI